MLEIPALEINITMQSLGYFWGAQKSGHWDVVAGSQDGKRPLCKETLAKDLDFYSCSNPFPEDLTDSDQVLPSLYG